MKKLLLALGIFPLATYAQSYSDTTHRLREVVIQAYPGKQFTLLQVPTSSTVLTSRQLALQQGVTLLPAMNTVPGVRMEERSPGSYRLSLRGSLLRSPFGIRNVKIYLDEIPLTDAGGNSYLNLSDPGSFQGIEVLKGPDGSQFGANSGGVILLHPAGTLPDSSRLHADIQGGSYGLFREQVGWQHQWGNYQLNVYQAVHRSDGYRDNSAMQRYYIQTAQQWQYNAHNQLKLLAFYSDLDYRTPGGLTAAQMDANPKAARPATPALPGAITQKAGIRNKTAFGGLVHTSQLSEHWQHVISVYGSNTHFENPFITNYEARDENTAGARTYIALQDQPLGNSGMRLDWTTGLEWQQTTSDIDNYGNRAGVRDTLQAASDITARQYFYFTGLTLRPGKQWVAEAAVSVNYYRYHFNDVAAGVDGKKKFTAELMPRFSLSYLITPALAARATVSRGYSPPSIAEVRASDNIINTGLQAETGWNYETGLRLNSRNNRFMADAAVFYYKLQDAIVRKLHDNGTEFFTNAGGTNQTGVEFQGSAWLQMPRREGFLRGIQLQESFTYSHFRFSNYNSAGKDFSGNALTGVPKTVVTSSLLIELPARVSLYGQYNFVDRLPLDDANTAFANEYHLVQAKVNWGVNKWLAVYAGADNLLNQRYNLGNDLNAVGARYYNPAPDRNYYGGVRVTL
ncbi:iron complex outermembrane recepter protein [Chitinophaga sp. YR627]|uniref:TonB-dependent receptor family protein n=1 Tax=Chitinophaga sp. YR627 TaxID=1881041 RepID=UPI0008E0AA8B|nr:TonB-dependent receptor [Chitinophaga sp. YR627]SFN52141.1 iron complex outermembrane recepter protein [Chitinophaga sp. YR627]